MQYAHQPLITIGITSFNAEETIERAIQCAQHQDWPNIEIIVVDDASLDNSVAIIKRLADKNTKIRLIQHEINKGYPSALNTIIKNAEGEYIAFFDDDDEHRNDRIKNQFSRLLKFQEDHSNALVLCYSHRRVFVDGIENAFVTAIGHKAPEPYGSMVADFLLWHEKKDGYVWGEFGSGTMMAPKSTLEQFLLDPAFKRCAEWDLAIRVALKGGYFISVDEPLVIQHKTNTEDKSGKKPLIYALMLRKKHKRYLERNRVYLGSLLQAYSRYYYFRNRPWKSRFSLALACILSPTKIMAEQIARRTHKNKS